MSAFGRRTTRIPADALEDLEIGRPTDPRQSVRIRIGAVASQVPGSGSGRVIHARSDKEQVEFGSGLDEADLEWLRGTIHYILTAPARRG